MAPVVLIDVRLPDVDGLEATRRIKARWPQIKVVVLSIFKEYSEQACDAGADGFVGKGETPDRLLATVYSVTQGAAA